MKKIISVLIIFILLFILCSILNHSNEIIFTIKYSYNIWLNNIFPSLFPFLILSELLMNYGFVELIGEIFKPIFEKVFKINGNAAFVFFMSIFSGFPSNSKYTKELYLQNKLNNDEATKILMFSFFSNPLFILGLVNSFILDKKLCLFILLSHYLSNIIIGLILRNYKPSNSSSKFSLKNAINNMHNKRINNEKFGIVITNSLINSINTLLLILGVITTCLILTTIIDNTIELPIIYKTILSGFLEITQGLKHVGLLNISNFYKCILITSILSFGGISIHLQIVSIISDTKIKYLPFLLSRIIHVIISIILFVILYTLF